MLRQCPHRYRSLFRPQLLLSVSLRVHYPLWELLCRWLLEAATRFPGLYLLRQHWSVPLYQVRLLRQLLDHCPPLRGRPLSFLLELHQLRFQFPSRSPLVLQAGLLKALVDGIPGVTATFFNCWS